MPSNDTNKLPEINTKPINPPRKSGSYLKDLIAAVAISVLYFGSAGLLFVIAQNPQDAAIGWLLIWYVLFFPVYLILLFGLFIKTFSDRAKTRGLVIMGCILVLLSLSLSIYNIHRQKVGEEVFYQSIVAAVLAVIALLPVIKLFRAHKVTSLILLLLSTSFIWLGIYGQSMDSAWAAQRLAVEKATSAKQEAIKNQATMKSEYAELTSLPYTFYVLPQSNSEPSFVKSDLLANVDNVSTSGSLTIFPNGYEDSQSPSITLFEIPLSSSDQINTNSTSCYSSLLSLTLVNGLLSKYSPCKYSFTTPKGSIVAVNNGTYNSYFFTKGKDYLYFEDKDNIYTNSAQQLGAFIDSLEPVAYKWFQ